jgi:hypothetical protein
LLHYRIENDWRYARASTKGWHWRDFPIKFDEDVFGSTVDTRHDNSVMHSSSVVFAEAGPPCAQAAVQLLLVGGQDALAHDGPTLPCFVDHVDLMADVIEFDASTLLSCGSHWQQK